jgi:hypothetical protein
VGSFLRRTKATRNVPLVFVEGAPDKVARVRDLLPDATFTTWKRVGPAIRKAIDRPPAAPAVPSSAMAGYSGTPLPKKLGIRPGATVALLDAPDGFEKTLGALPEGVSLRHDLRAASDPTILFVRSRRDLARGLDRAAKKVNGGKLWIAWPKKTSGVETDVSERHVRADGIARGLVDYKIAAIDATWSGLLFARKR